MSISIVWNTPAGSIGTFNELTPINFTFSANPPTGATALIYVLLNGSYPSTTFGGSTFTLNQNTGLLSGTAGKVADEITSEFTIRAYAYNGPSLLTLSDRTFSMTITGADAPSFITPAGQLYSPPLQDSTWTTFQIEVDNPDPNTTVLIKIVEGQLPPGLEINSAGLIRGYAQPPVDALNLPITQSYSFTLEASTESGIVYRDFQITVANQELNMGYVGRAPAIFNTRPLSYVIPITNVDYGYYLPSSGYMGVYSQDNNFVFRIIGHDWANEPLEMSLISGTLPVALQTNFTYSDSNVSVTIITGQAGISYNVGDTLRVLGSDIGGLSPDHDLTFTVASVDAITGAILEIDPLSYTGTNCNTDDLNPGPFENIFLVTVTGVGVGAQATIARIGSDWITGNLSTSLILVDQYSFEFSFTNPQTGLSSDVIQFSMTVAGQNNNVPINLDVNWLTGSNLGSLINGNISTFAVEAISVAGFPLEYQLASVEVTNTTAISNELTCSNTNILVLNQPIVFSGTTFGNIVAGTIYYVLDIIDATTIIISLNPGGSEFVLASAAGSMFITQYLPPNLTLNTYGQIVGRLAFESTSSLQSQNNEIAYYISIEAYNPDYPEISSVKQFTLTTVQKFTEPYDNLYIRALLSISDRGKLLSLIQDNNLIPQSSLYRPLDSYFGVAQGIVYQHLYGIPAETIQTYINSLQFNHYWRYLILGPIKTAAARDADNNIIYEVVYSEIVDNLVYKGTSIRKSFQWPNLINGVPVTVYPNSLPNMREQVTDSIPGLNTDSSILPLWMTTQQPDGNILGFIPAWVICYTLPGHAQQIKENIEQNWIYKLNELAFQIDRLEVDRSFTFDYDPSVIPASWNSLPSGVVTDDQYDAYIYYPQKNILY